MVLRSWFLPRGWRLALVLVGLASGGAACADGGAPVAGLPDGRVAGWGIDACLTVHVDPVSLPQWIALLHESNVRWLRERNVWVGEGFDPGIRERMQALRAAGFNIVAFAGTPSTVVAQRAGHQLPEDLQAVYASGFRQGREYAGLVSAWEMTGEPDVGYCRDLPDRLAAYNKAMYLGLKAGSRSAGRPEAGLPDSRIAEQPEAGGRIAGSSHRDPIVLMGALALPPGPWWERAADNGLLDYTDAYNFHFYGNAEDLTSVMGAHREAMLELGAKSRELGANHSDWVGRKRGIGLTALSPQLSTLNSQLRLPLWLTECGVNATVPGDFLNAERREFQAEFTRSTARQALAAREVAVFMPFILVHRDDPHAMTLPSPPAPLPAWDVYAKLTRETEWPRRALSAPSGECANPVVVQWMPAEGTASHKVAGTYRVGPNEVMTGEFRVYNFGECAVTGELGAKSLELRANRTEPDAGDRMAGSRRSVAGLRFFTPAGWSERMALSIPAGGCVAVPVIYTPGTDTGYFREWVKAGFREASGRVSPVAFGVERRPEEADFVRETVAVYPLRGDSRLKPPEVNVEGKPFGPWRVFNGLVGGERPAARGEGRETGSRRPVDRKSEDGGRAAGLPDCGATGVRFSVAKPANDPLAPTYALAVLRGVPENARFLRVRLDRPMVRTATVRVDLIDADGERFTIWENLGNPYGGSSRDVWLGLADFHPYFWSKAVAGNRRLRPDKVREISLRFYLLEGGSMDVELEWMRARSAR